MSFLGVQIRDVVDIEKKDVEMEPRVFITCGTNAQHRRRASSRQSCLVVVIEMMPSYVAEAGLEVCMQQRTALNSRSPCIYLPSSEGSRPELAGRARLVFLLGMTNLVLEVFHPLLGLELQQLDVSGDFGT